MPNVRALYRLQRTDPEAKKAYELEYDSHFDTGTLTVLTNLTGEKKVDCEVDFDELRDLAFGKAILLDNNVLMLRVGDLEIRNDYDHKAWYCLDVGQGGDRNLAVINSSFEVTNMDSFRLYQLKSIYEASY